MPFRAAYKLVGQLVALCIERGEVLETLPLEEYKKLSDSFDADLYDEISLRTCVEKRISAGGTGLASVKSQIKSIREFLNND